MTNQPLGRGLSSLIPKKSSLPSAPAALPVAPLPVASPKLVEVQPMGEASMLLNDKRIYDIPLGQIDPNPHQPRHRVGGQELDELVDSIRQHGVLQPIIVTRHQGRYQLIAGERRFRSAERLGLPTIPAIIREAKELEQLEIAIVENVQRQDLNPVEEALGYQQLSEEFGLTQEEIAKKVGKRRTTVANAMRVLSLPSEMLQAIRDGRLSGSHAKILLTAVTPQDRERLFKQILEQDLPVRAAAQLGQSTTVRRHVRRNIDPAVQAAEDELRSRFGTKVKITKREHRGSISIEFYSEEEYQQLLNRFR